MIKKRIIFSNFDDRENPDYGGGGAIAIHEVAKRLSKNFEILVLTGWYPHAPRIEIIDGVVYKRIGIHFFSPKIDQLLFAFSLPWYALWEKYDMWIENMTPPLGPSLLPLFTRRPVIALVHMLPGMDMWRKYHIPFFLYERLGLKLYSDCIVLSKEMQDTIQRFHARASFHIIPNGVAMPVLNGEYVPKHILFLGRIEVDQKGLDLLIEAYARLPRDTAYPLIIAGDGAKSEVEKLKALIAHSSCAGRIKMVGRVDGEYKAQLFQEAAVVVLPSRFESFGLVALEALSYGIPVVTFDIDGFKWLEGKLAEKAIPFEVSDLSDGIMRALGLRSMEGRDNRLTFAARFQWDAVTDAYQSVLHEVFSRRDIHRPADQHPMETSASMETFIQDIITKQIPCFFISPHLDDAILSAGALLAHLSGKTAVSVVTVFTEATATKPTLSARAFLRQCGYRDARELFAKRRAEDEAILQALKVTSVHLGQIDALWRPRTRVSFVRRLLGKLLTEFLVVYPTYRFHIIYGIIVPEDKQYIAKIKEQLRTLTAGLKEYYVFCPQAIGNHVDHVVVRQICGEIFSKLIYWSDFPYNLTRDMSEKSAWFWGKGLERKQALIMSYQTQAQAMFQDNAVPLIPEEYIQRGHFAQY